MYQSLRIFTLVSCFTVLFSFAGHAQSAGIHVQHKANSSANAKLDKGQAGVTKKAASSKKTKKKINNVNLNTASVDQLVDALDGVGHVKAQAIVAYRKSNGKFKNIDDLIQVSGIGESILKRNRSKLRLQ